MFPLTHVCIYLIAVVHFPREAPGEAELWEDSQGSENGLRRPLSDALAHGLQGVCVKTQKNTASRTY